MLLVFFYKRRHLLPLSCCKNLYFSLIYSYIIYGLEVYGLSSYTSLKQLIVTCNRALRALQDKPRDYPVKLLYANYNTLPMDLLFKFVMLNLVYKCFNNSEQLPRIIKDMFVKNCNIHNYKTRSSNNFHLFGVDRSNSLVFSGSSLWNDIPDSIKNTCTINTF